MVALKGRLGKGSARKDVDRVLMGRDVLGVFRRNFSPMMKELDDGDSVFMGHMGSFVGCLSEAYCCRVRHSGGGSWWEIHYSGGPSFEKSPITERTCHSRSPSLKRPITQKARHSRGP